MATIKMAARQRTFGNYGHFLNHRQALSHCGRFLYYDTRNADPDIAKTSRIESLDLVDDTVRVIYDTQSLLASGPGVGAVVCHPTRSTVLFIHGLTHCNDNHPYSMTRRFGAWTSFDPLNPRCTIDALESRSLQSKLPWGMLGGGTHAHSFSKQGDWVSFTYNDAMLPERRSVGFAYVDHWDNAPDPRHPQKQSVFEEEFQGRGWAALALIPEAPILSAREECWVQGQIDSKALLALAMIVKIPSADAHQLPIDEIYLAEFPIHARQWPNQLAADSNPGSLRASELMADGWRMQPPPGIQLRRLTNTESLKYPGIAGPRHWLIGSGCGRWIYTLMRNQEGIVRLVQVSVQDGSIRWLSENRQSITHPIAIDSESKRISYLVDRNLMIFDLQTGQETQMQWKDQGFEQVIGPVQFLNHSEGLFWNAKPTGSPWLQIWTD